MKTLLALPYYGGKSGHSRGGWIASMIPDTKQSLYCEPYAGMLGVLLQLSPAKSEIVNDLNGRLINWWTMVRERPDELARAIALTPISESEYRNCLLKLDEGEPLERARAYTCVIIQSLLKTDSPSTWRTVFDKNADSQHPDYWERIISLSYRLRHVQLLCRPASKIIRRVIEIENSIMYLDPPYRDANTGPYKICVDEREKIIDMLKHARGKIAISGYGNEWDETGFERYEYQTYWRGIGESPNSSRTEVLWANYTPKSSIQKKLI